MLTIKPINPQPSAMPSQLPSLRPTRNPSEAPSHVRPNKTNFTSGHFSFLTFTLSFPILKAPDAKAQSEADKSSAFKNEPSDRLIEVI